MKPRRIACLFFGILWAIIFGMTNFAFALGDPAPVECTGLRDCDPYPARWTHYLIWIELSLLVVAGVIFYRAEMRDDD